MYLSAAMSSSDAANDCEISKPSKPNGKIRMENIQELNRKEKMEKQPQTHEITRPTFKQFLAQRRAAVEGHSFHNNKNRITLITQNGSVIKNPVVGVKNCMNHEAVFILPKNTKKSSKNLSILPQNSADAVRKMITSVRKQENNNKNYKSIKLSPSADLPNSNSGRKESIDVGKNSPATGILPNDSQSSHHAGIPLSADLNKGPPGSEILPKDSQTSHLTINSLPTEMWKSLPGSEMSRCVPRSTLKNNSQIHSASMILTSSKTTSEVGTISSNAIVRMQKATEEMRFNSSPAHQTGQYLTNDIKTRFTLNSAVVDHDYDTPAPSFHSTNNISDHNYSGSFISNQEPCSDITEKDTAEQAAMLPKLTGFNSLSGDSKKGPPCSGMLLEDPLPLHTRDNLASADSKKGPPNSGMDSTEITVQGFDADKESAVKVERVNANETWINMSDCQVEEILNHIGDKVKILNADDPKMMRDTKTVLGTDIILDEDVAEEVFLVNEEGNSREKLPQYLESAMIPRDSTTNVLLVNEEEGDSKEKPPPVLELIDLPGDCPSASSSSTSSVTKLTKTSETGGNIYREKLSATIVTSLAPTMDVDVADKADTDGISASDIMNKDALSATSVAPVIEVTNVALNSPEFETRNGVTKWILKNTKEHDNVIHRKMKEDPTLVKKNSKSPKKRLKEWVGKGNISMTLSASVSDPDPGVDAAKLVRGSNKDDLEKVKISEKEQEGSGNRRRIFPIKFIRITRSVKVRKSIGSAKRKSNSNPRKFVKDSSVRLANYAKNQVSICGANNSDTLQLKETNNKAESQKSNLDLSCHDIKVTQLDILPNEFVKNDSLASTEEVKIRVCKEGRLEDPNSSSPRIKMKSDVKTKSLKRSSAPKEKAGIETKDLETSSSSQNDSLVRDSVESLRKLPASTKDLVDSPVTEQSMEATVSSCKKNGCTGGRSSLEQKTSLSNEAQNISNHEKESPKTRPGCRSSENEAVMESVSQPLSRMDSSDIEQSKTISGSLEFNKNFGESSSHLNGSIQQKKERCPTRRRSKRKSMPVKYDPKKPRMFLTQKQLRKFPMRLMSSDPESPPDNGIFHPVGDSMKESKEDGEILQSTEDSSMTDNKQEISTDAPIKTSHPKDVSLVEKDGTEMQKSSQSYLNKKEDLQEVDSSNPPGYKTLEEAVEIKVEESSQIPKVTGRNSNGTEDGEKSLKNPEECPNKNNISTSGSHVAKVTASSCAGGKPDPSSCELQTEMNNNWKTVSPNKKSPKICTGMKSTTSSPVNRSASDILKNIIAQNMRIVDSDEGWKAGGLKYYKKKRKESKNDKSVIFKTEKLNGQSCGVSKTGKDVEVRDGKKESDEVKKRVSPNIGRDKVSNSRRGKAVCYDENDTLEENSGEAYHNQTENPGPPPSSDLEKESVATQIASRKHPESGTKRRGYIQSIPEVSQLKTRHLSSKKKSTEKSRSRKRKRIVDTPDHHEKILSLTSQGSSSQEDLITDDQRCPTAKRRKVKPDESRSKAGKETSSSDFLKPSTQKHSMRIKHKTFSTKRRKINLYETEISPEDGPLLSQAKTYTGVIHRKLIYPYIPLKKHIMMTFEPGVATCCFCHLPTNHLLGIGDLFGPYRPQAEEVMSRHSSVSDKIRYRGKEKPSGLENNSPEVSFCMCMIECGLYKTKFV